MKTATELIESVPVLQSFSTGDLIAENENVRVWRERGIPEVMMEVLDPDSGRWEMLFVKNLD
jgi:hypothetical protein